jgi:hypothetical protein
MNQRATPKPPAAAPKDPAPTKVEDPTPGRSSHTTPEVKGRLAPRLPHERDESSDSQTSAPRPVIEQARQDVRRGLVDTDRGPVLDEVYEQRVRTPDERAAGRDGPPAASPAGARSKRKR